MTKRPLLYVLVVLVVLGCVATSHALLGSRLRASASTKRPLHIDTAIQLGQVDATGGGNAAPVQVASAVQLGSVSASGGGNAYPTGITSGVALGSVTRSINGAVIYDDSFTGPALDPNWTSFGPWDEVYGPSINNFALTGGMVQLTSNSVNAGAYYAPSASDTSQVTLKALYSSTMGAFKGVTLRSGNGSASATGLGYQVYLYNYASGNYTRLAIARNSTVVFNKTVSVSGTVNHTLKAIYSGGTVTAYIDGTSLGSYTDASPIPPGHPGIFINGNSSTPVNNTQLDDWSDGGGSAVVLADWTTKPPAGTALRTDGHWSVTGLVGAWPLNEGSGTTAKNVVTSTNGTLGSTQTWVANGISNDVTANTGGSHGLYSWMQNNASFTMVAKVTTASSTSLNALMGFGSTSLLFFQNSASSLVFKQAGLASDRITATGIPTNGSTYTVAAAFDGSTINRAIYIDGVQKIAGQTTGTFSSVGAIQLGLAGSSAAMPGLAGTLHYALFYNRALTATEIASLSANPWQIFQPH